MNFSLISITPTESQWSLTPLSALGSTVVPTAALRCLLSLAGGEPAASARRSTSVRRWRWGGALGSLNMMGTIGSGSLGMSSSSVALDHSISLSDSHSLASPSLFVFRTSITSSGVGVSSSWASSPMPKASPRFSSFV